jgi:hypothetical protein
MVAAVIIPTACSASEVCADLFKKLGDGEEAHAKAYLAMKGRPDEAAAVCAYRRNTVIPFYRQGLVRVRTIASQCRLGTAKAIAEVQGPLNENLAEDAQCRKQGL